MLKSAGIIFSALVFLAGCATTPNEPLPPDWSATNAVSRPAILPTNRPVTPLIRKNPPPAIPFHPPSVPVTTWMSLNRWAAENKIGQPHRLSDMPVAAYAIGSTNGVMVLEIGSREAAWNGIQIHLGFAPEFIDGEIFLHGLDLQKNLEPLLCGPPLEVGPNRAVVIDPGHGGANIGTRSILDGHFEKEFTLDWAKRLTPLLETNGWKVLLTRTSDVMVSNYDRVTFAAAHHADVFISLHFNATPDRDKIIGGLETYCLTPTGMPSTLTRGYNDSRSENLPNNHFDAQNLQLAVRVHGALLRATGLEDRGVRRARFDTVLRGQQCPAILIEGGYLSNPREAALIESAEYRQKLAEAVAAALRQNEDGK